MLKVFPIQDKAEQAALCERCGVKFDADLLAYQATVDGRFVGVCQFKLHPDGGILYDLAPLKGEDPNQEAIFVMGRAALNFIDLCGTHTLSADTQSGDIVLLKAIGLKPLNIIYLLHKEVKDKTACDNGSYLTRNIYANRLH